MKSIGKWTVALSIALLALAATAETFPEKPIRIVLTFPPGGTSDAVGRPLAVEMSKRLGVPVLLDHKPGAGGTIGTQYVSRAAPDGYTLLMAITGHAINPSLYKLSYDTLNDFSGVGFISRQGAGIFYLNPKFPADTMKEFLAYAANNPGKVTLASAGNGASSHLSVELLAQKSGIKILHVPYKGGAPSVTAVIGGEVSGVFAGPDTMTQVQAGRLKAMAVTTSKRSPLFPQLPTIMESGVPGFDLESWYSILAPAGTPTGVIQKLNSTINSILTDPAYRGLMDPQGYSSAPSTPQELDAHIRSEMIKWADLIKSADIRIQ